MLETGVYHLRRKHNAGFCGVGVGGWDQDFIFLVNNISLDTVYITQ